MQKGHLSSGCTATDAISTSSRIIIICGGMGSARSHRRRKRMRSDITTSVSGLSQETIVGLIAEDADDHREDLFSDGKTTHLLFRLATEVKRLCKRVQELESGGHRKE